MYQLSAQFPGPTSPREFITLLITSENALSEASKIGSTTPRHWMVVSIPVSHPKAPPRDGMVRGFYESIEMIREIPLEGNEDAETNPVEWIMVTRSDPGGGIPRFMVERNVPSSIVADAVKFLDWACARDDVDLDEAPKAEQETTKDAPQSPNAQPGYSMEHSNGIGAGVGTSIAERPSSIRRRASHRTIEPASPAQETYLSQLKDAVGNLGAYVPDMMNPMPQLQPTSSSSSSSTASTTDSFASATQFTSAPEGLPIDETIPTPSTISSVSDPVDASSPHARELTKIEAKKAQLRNKLDAERSSREATMASLTSNRAKDADKAAEKHARDQKKQEEKYAREMQKLDARRDKETRKLAARQQKDAEKSKFNALLHERDDARQQKHLLDVENRILKEQIGSLQRENTRLVVSLGRSELGREILASVREGAEGRARAGSRASGSSGVSGKVGV